MQSRGAALWNANSCAACHVAGQAAPGASKPLENLTQRYTVESLAAFLPTPQPPMPVFAFDDQQRRDLAVYVLRANP